MNFGHLQTVCLPIGFSDTANQPLAYALTAHPNMVMGNQLNLLENWWNNGKPLAIDSFLSGVLEMNHKMNKGEIRYVGGNKYYFIDGQWQGRFDRLTVIGDCSPTTNTTVLKEHCRDLKISTDNIKVSLKFIFLVRNPYDMLSHGAISSFQERTRTEILNIMIDKFIKACRVRKHLLAEISQMSDQPVFIWRMEDHIANPQQKLAELCEFLNVEGTESYLNACAKIFHKNPSKSRYLIDWPEEYKIRVATAIGQYNFLSGYSWDS